MAEQTVPKSPSHPPAVPDEKELADWVRRMREQGVKGPLTHPDHDPATCSECQRTALLGGSPMPERTEPCGCVFDALTDDPLRRSKGCIAHGAFDFPEDAAPDQPPASEAGLDPDDVGAELSRLEDDLLAIHDALVDAGRDGAINAESIIERIKDLASTNQDPEEVESSG